MGYLVGERPTNEISGINLDSYYTLSGSTVKHGRVLILAFVDPSADDYIGYLNNIQSILTAHAGGNIDAIGILYKYSGTIGSFDFTTYSDNLTAAGVSFPIVNNGPWGDSTSVALHYSAGITGSPWVYLISKYYLIIDKNIASGSISGVVTNLLAGPEITTIAPTTVDPYHALSAIGVTFAEAVLGATTPSNYTLGGTGRGSIPVHPTIAVLDGVIANKYNLSLGTGTPGDGNLSITLSNITDTIFYTPAPVISPVITYYMDVTPPSIGLSQTPLTSTNTDVTITATINDTGSGVAVQKYASGSQVVDYFAAGGSSLVGTTFNVSVNGIYTVYAKDNAGNEAVQTINITNIDTIAPAVVLSNLPATLTNSSSINITVAGVDVVAYKYSLDGSALSSEVTVASAIALSSLAEGAHTLSVIGRDVAGNWQSTPTTYSWQIDFSVTAAELFNTPASLTGNTSVNITVGGTGVVSYKFMRDGSSWSSETPISTPITANALSNGPHTLSVIGKNSVGNWQSTSSPTIASWTIDVQSPVITSFILTSPNPATLTTITFTLSASDNTGIAGWIITESSTQPSASDSDWLSSQPTIFAISNTPGTKEVYAWVKDSVGNVSVITAQSHFSVTLNTVDMTPPRILSLKINPHLGR